MPYFIQGNTNNRSTPEEQLEYPYFLTWLICDPVLGAYLSVLVFPLIFKEDNYWFPY